MDINYALFQDEYIKLWDQGYVQFIRVPVADDSYDAICKYCRFYEFFESVIPGFLNKGSSYGI